MATAMRVGGRAGVLPPRGTSAVLGAADALEDVCERGVQERGAVEDCARGVRAALKDVKLAETAEIEALKGAAEAFSNMLLRAATVDAAAAGGAGALPLHAVERWQATAEVRSPSPMHSFIFRTPPPHPARRPPA